MEFASFVLIGLFAGALSGLFGIGGGILIVPALVLVMGFKQQVAQGTSLAMLALPVAAFGAWQYHQEGQVDFKASGLIALGFIVGITIAARFATGLDETLLKRIFSVFLVAVAVQVWLKA